MFRWMDGKIIKDRMMIEDIWDNLVVMPIKNKAA